MKLLHVIRTHAKPSTIIAVVALLGAFGVTLNPDATEAAVVLLPVVLDVFKPLA